MPWTLYRYILRELLAILLLCTAVLVTVLSFFIAIKPLADGLLDAGSLIKFVVYTMPTMLGFVLPFAGAFASTLVFLRLASDHEITACAACGISYFRILLPVVLLGMLMLGLLLYLSNFVIPGYYKKATRTAQADALTMIESKLNKGLPVEMDQFVLYAEQAQTVRPSEIDARAYPVPPAKMIQLQGVVFGQYDFQGKMRWDYTASRAFAMLFRKDDRSWVTIRLRESVYYDPTLGRMQRAEIDPLDLGPIEPPNPFEDEPRFMSYPDLMKLTVYPQRYPRVARAMRELRIELGREKLRLGFARDGVRGGVELVGPLEGETFRITAGRVERVGADVRLLAAEGRPVQIIHDRRGKRVWSIEADEALVRFEASEFDQDPAVLMEMAQAKVYDPGPERTFTEGPVSLPRMRWPEPVLAIDTGAGALPEFEQLRDLSLREPFRSDADVVTRRKNLRQHLHLLGLEVLSQKHERAALAVAGFLLLLLGALLSIQLRKQMTLVVYFWSFILAIVALVLINTGSNLVSDGKMSPALGMSILWLGNVVLAAVGGWVYCRFAKN